MNIYHLIPIKRRTDWFHQNRVFYFQLGKSKKHEAFIDDNYERIKKAASGNGLTFIYHKKSIDESNAAFDDLSDREFVKKIAGMGEVEFYDELAYLIFDFNVWEPFYLVRRYDEKNLIGWVYHRRSVLNFPFEAFQPLDNLLIGAYSHVEIQLPEAEAVGKLIYPSTDPESFFSAIYQCTKCNDRSEIYIANDYDLYNIADTDTECACCKQEKELISSGDLIYRKDWPDPDDDPWQMQCAYLPEGVGCCKECEPKDKSDYRDLRPCCAHCDGEMVYVGS